MIPKPINYDGSTISPPDAQVLAMARVEYSPRRTRGARGYRLPMTEYTVQWSVKYRTDDKRAMHRYTAELQNTRVYREYDF